MSITLLKGSLAQAGDLFSSDILIGGFGQSFNHCDDLLNILWHTEPGEVLPLEFLRTGKRQYCEIRIPVCDRVVEPLAHHFSEMKSP